MWLLVVTALAGLAWWLISATRCVQIFSELWDRIVFSWQLPGPGYFSVMFNASEDKALSWIIDLTQTYGSIYRVWFAEDLTVFIAEPELIKDVLSSHAVTEKSADYQVVEMWLGKGLLTNGGDSWHRQRKLLTPSFHFRILSTFKEPMEECCATMVAKLRPLADGERTVDVYPFVSLMALDVICETAMGIRIDSQLKSDSAYVMATKTICQIVHEQLFSVWQRFPILFDRTENGRRSRAALKVLHGMTKDVIARRRHEMATADQSTSSTPTPAAGTVSDEDAFGGSKKRFAFLDSLLLAQQSGVQLTDQNIEDEVNTFMFEGHDTTSSAISFAMYLLSRHADVQQRAFDEVTATHGTESDSMPYMEAVIKETLRLYPSVPFYSRNVTTPVQVGEFLIPKGTTIAVLAYMAHRNGVDFPQPDAFRPDRYLDGSAQHHPFANVAFSAGPRNCIGQRFAMLELKCALSHVLRAFELLPGPADGEPRLVARLILNSSNGVLVRLRQRTSGWDAAGV